jgi:predicted ATP-grasp superfamily ATP-dependent carboligase
MSRVLVTDGLWRKSLAAVRALGRRGIDITVSGDSRFITSFFSRYCRKRLILPDAADDPERFFAGLMTELRGIRYDAMFPMEDASMRIVSERRSEVQKHTALPIPPHAQLLQAMDKAETAKLAARLDVPVPRSFALKDRGELAQVSSSVNFPVVVKPTVGSGSRGVRFAANTAELKRLVIELWPKYPHLLVQERIPSHGQGVGAALLFDSSHTPVAGFTYKRLREYPITGGPSTVRESTRDPRLLEWGIRLLRALDWYGVAMVEFKIDPRDGQPKLIEINPRFWGSLELAIAAGVDFPNLLPLAHSGRHPAFPQ